MVDHKADMEKKAKQNLTIAIVLILLGTAWFIYKLNPGGVLRQWSDDEKKVMREEEEAAKKRAKKK